jgi:hypothetical protein
MLGQPDIRMTLATYTRVTAALEEAFLDPAVDTPLTKGSEDIAKGPYFSAICRTLVSGGTRIRTGDTMIFSPRTPVRVRPVK